MRKECHLAIAVILTFGSTIGGAGCSGGPTEATGSNAQVSLNETPELVFISSWQSALRPQTLIKTKKLFEEHGCRVTDITVDPRGNGHQVIVADKNCLSAKK